MVGVAVSVLAGCAAPAPAPEPLPDGLDVSLVQQRGDISVDRVQVHLDNGTDADVVVSSASVSSPVLGADAAWETDRVTTLAPGRSVNLPVLLPEVRCTGDDSAATVRLGLADGTAVTGALPDELGVLDRLAQSACDREDVEAVARVEAVAVQPGADALRLEVTVTPTGGDGEVELVELRGTPLLRFATGEQWPLGGVVRGADAPTSVTVDVVPRRCDPHAIAEDKVGTRLELVARVDGREAVYPLPRSQRVADDLLGYTAAFCGLTG